MGMDKWFHGWSCKKPCAFTSVSQIPNPTSVVKLLRMQLLAFIAHRLYEEALRSDNLQDNLYDATECNFK